MQTAIHKSHKNHATSHAKKIKLHSSLNPLKKINKKIVVYVTKKPYQTAGIATLICGVIVGVAVARLKHFIK